MERSDRGTDRDEVTPLRADERRAVRAEVEGRLRHGGVRLTGEETDDELATLADVVERFEGAIIAAGGDRFVDAADSSEPEHPEHVLPPRADDESPEAYMRRVEAAITRIGEPGPDATG
jgi:hypothetical protein